MKKHLLIPAALSVFFLCAQLAPESVLAQAPAAQQAPKMTAVMLHAAALRDRPRADSTGEVVAPAETRMRLEKHTQNADGSWWYVTATGLGGGWMLESEMGSPQQE